MSYNPGLALAPKIVIGDYNDVELWKFESEQIQPSSPVQDFKPEMSLIHAGVNDDHGYFSFMFEDTDKLFINATAKADSKIPQQSNIQLLMGRTPALLNRWFYGKVFKTQMIRPETNILYQFVFAIGWGIRTTERIATIRRFQDKLADGLTPDTTDGKTSGPELYKSLFRDTDHYIYRSLPKETEIDSQGYDNVQNINVRFADLQETFQTWTHVQSRIASSLGTVFGVDQNRKAFMYQPGSLDSGFLITNDTTSEIATNWNQNKLAYIIKSFDWGDSTERSGYNLLHIYGAAADQLDYNKQTANAAFDMSTFHIAIPFFPNQVALQKIALKARRRGTPQDDILIRVVGATAQASGSPKVTDQRKGILISKEKLQLLDQSFSSYLEIPFEQIPLNPLSLYFIIVPKYGSTPNTILLDYNTGAVANAYYDSPDGTAWTTRTGDAVPAFVLRTYPTRAVNISLFATRAFRLNGNRVREKAVPFRDLQSVEAGKQMIIGIAELITRARRINSSLKVLPPDLPPVLGKYALLTDNFTGLKQNLTLLGYDGVLNADEESNLGLRELDLTVEAFE